jgi:hypothetical protein
MADRSIAILLRQAFYPRINLSRLRFRRHLRKRGVGPRTTTIILKYAPRYRLASLKGKGNISSMIDTHGVWHSKGIVLLFRHLPRLLALWRGCLALFCDRANGLSRFCALRQRPWRFRGSFRRSRRFFLPQVPRHLKHGPLVFRVRLPVVHPLGRTGRQALVLGGQGNRARRRGFGSGYGFARGRSFGL